MHLFLEYGKIYRGYRRKQRKIQKRFTFLFAERRKDRQGMNCKECEKLIPAFIAGELSDKDLESFLAHVESCPDCEEELTIQILIAEGMSRLEDGRAFDLKEEINRRMEGAEHKLRMHKVFRYMRITFEILAAIVVGTLLVFFVL